MVTSAAEWRMHRNTWWWCHGHAMPVPIPSLPYGQITEKGLCHCMYATSAFELDRVAQGAWPARQACRSLALGTTFIACAGREALKEKHQAECAHMRVRMHTCVHADTHTCTHAHTHARLQTQTYARTQIHTHTVRAYQDDLNGDHCLAPQPPVHLAKLRGTRTNGHTCRRARVKNRRHGDARLLGCRAQARHTQPAVQSQRAAAAERATSNGRERRQS